jgi:hypothetical protein
MSLNLRSWADDVYRASIAVIVRMGFVMKFVTNDFLYDTVDIAIWSDIEQGLAITAGSLATLRPLYRLVSDRFGWSTRASSNGPKIKSQYDRSGFSDHNKRKRSGLFSFTTLNPGEKEDEEYGLENCRPIKLEEHVVPDKRGSWVGHNVF